MPAKNALPRAGRFLLVASTGGHLAQLHRLRRSLGASPESIWVTFDSPQSRSLIGDEPVFYVPYIAPRDLLGATRAAVQIFRRFRGEHFDGAVSTGAALAVAALPTARILGIPSLYIESVSRTDGPSLSGKILAATHMVNLRTQHPNWVTARWKYDGNVLEDYCRVAGEHHRGTKKLFVTLGTIKPYRFDRLVDALLSSGLAGAETVWQLGETRRPDLPGKVYSYMESSLFDSVAKASDVVITHAGVGTILRMLEMGIHPVVIPRRMSFAEHVDDHQLQISKLLEASGVVTVCRVEDLGIDTILEAARWQTELRGNHAE